MPIKLRAQAAAEYVMLLALIFVLIAAMMLVSFRQQEVTLAIAGARLACIEYTSANSSVACNEVRYFYISATNVTIVPSTDAALADYQKAELTGKIIANLVSIFKPGAIVIGKCYSAPSYSYCIEYPT
ncbi:MAG: hypothetical protein AABX01_02470 [Candidatus Micrarchaeota archaeon]